MLKKTSFANTAGVFSQAEEYFMYTPSMSTSNNYDEAEANAAALLPNFNLKMRIQLKGIWKHRAAKNQSALEGLGSESGNSKLVVGV